MAKVKVLFPCVIDGIPRKAGDIVDVSEDDLRGLKNIGRGAEATEADPAPPEDTGAGKGKGGKG